VNAKGYASTALCVLMAGFVPVAASAELIYTNNMSDAAVTYTAVDSSPKHVTTTWCVDTGDYNKHEVKTPLAELHADIMHEGCKENEQVFQKRTLTLMHSDTMAAEYLIKGTAGKYTLTGPISHVIQPDPVAAAPKK
jgi:hypothetical protein